MIGKLAPLLLASLLSAQACAVAGPVKVQRDDILLLAHFNESPKPEIGNSEGMSVKATISSGRKGFPFKDSEPSPECLDLSGKTGLLAFPGKDNVDIREGTVQFWLKPSWDPSQFCRAGFLHFGYAQERKKSFEWEGHNSLYFSKDPRKNILILGQGGRSIQGREFELSSELWIQAACTWDIKTGKLKFYVDGELVGEQTYLPPERPPLELLLGGEDWHCLARSFIDELRILKKALTEEEIRQDYKAQKDGQEFESPVKTQRKDASCVFSPADLSGRKDAKASLAPLEIRSFFSPGRITLDGSLDEEAWRSAQVISGFKRRDGAEAAVQTKVSLLYDNEAFYVGAVMDEPDMGALTANLDQRDLPIYADDCFEILFDIAGRPDTFYHIAVNSLGAIYDDRNRDRNWNGNGIAAAAHKGKDGWSVELKIPFSNLGTPPPLVGDIWGVRLCRERQASKDNSSLPAVPASGHSFDEWGFLGSLIWERSLAPTAGAVKVESKLESLMPGSNNLSVDVFNQGGEAMNLKLRAVQLDSGNMRLACDETELAVAPGSSAPASMNIAVRDDRIDRLSIQLRTPQGEPLWGRSVPRDFVKIKPSIVETERKLREISGEMERDRTSKHPLFKGAVKSFDLISSILKDYRGRIEEAMSKGHPLSKEEWESFASQVQGFNDWLDSRRYLLWRCSPWENGSPDAIPPADYDERPSVDFRMAGNEMEQATFCISPFLATQGLELRFVPMSIKQGGTYISSYNFKIRLEPFVNDGQGKLMTAPLIEAPGNIVRVLPGQTARVWLSFDSTGVPPGEYFGTLKIKHLNDYSFPERSVPVSIRVWDFALPETQDWPISSFFWTGMFVPTDECAMLSLLHKYHVNWAMTEVRQYYRGYIDDRKSLAPKDPRYEKLYSPYINPELVDANRDFFLLAKRLKMKVVFAWGNPENPEWFKLMIPKLKSYGFTYDELSFQGLRDEFRASQIPAGMKLIDAVHSFDPQVPFESTYYAAPPPSGATLKQLIETRAIDAIRTWKLADTKLSLEKPESTASNIKFFREHGRKLWIYHCRRNMQERSPLEYYRLSFWEGYLLGLDGVAYWTYDGDGGDDGYDHRDGYDEGIAWRGIGHETIPTKRFEAVREGLEDVAYMDILKGKIAAKAAATPDADLSKYRLLIGKKARDMVKSCSQEQVDTWRLEMAAAILELGK